MRLFTKASVKALRRDVEALTADCIIDDPDVVSSLFAAPKGRQTLADLFACYEAAAGDVGDEKALDALVDAARSEIADRFAGLNGRSPVGTQALAERLFRTYVGMVRDDRSVLDHFRGAMPVANRDQDVASVEGFYAEAARQFVRARAGNPDGDLRVEDMATAREMFRAAYDRVVASQGEAVARRAAIEHARTIATLAAAIYDAPNPEQVATGAEELVQSLLATP